MEISKSSRKIANVRKDFLHKITTTISKNHAFVCIEDLQITKMTESAKGTIVKAGEAVRRKVAQNRRILDQGWGMFRD